MNILVQYFYGGPGTGALEHFKVLLSSYQNNFPTDQLYVLCRPHEKMNSITDLNPRIKLVHFGGKINLEIERLILHTIGFQTIIKKYNINLIWHVNIGSYLKLKVPQVVSLSNAFEVYPYHEISKFTKNNRNKFSVLLLRFFYQLSIRNVDLITVQTRTMKEVVK
jgi:hypothetical protein